jgi:hypothetical protein
MKPAPYIFPERILPLPLGARNHWFYAREFRRFVMVQQYVFTIEEVKEAVRQATETQSGLGLLAKSAHQSSGGYHEGTGSSCGGDCG